MLKGVSLHHFRRYPLHWYKKPSCFVEARAFSTRTSNWSHGHKYVYGPFAHIHDQKGKSFGVFAVLLTASVASSAYAYMDSDVSSVTSNSYKPTGTGTGTGTSTGNGTGTSNGNGNGTGTEMYRRSEIARHISKDDGGIWVTYKSGVYDVTDFIANHPGGAEKLMMAAGKDLTELWRLAPFQQHFQSPLAFELLEEMRIGSLYPEDVVILDRKDWELRPAQFASDVIYDCIVVGSGLAGLQTVHSLINTHKLSPEKVLVLEAQDYVGGRVRQVSDFIKGVDVDVGAEFLHGTGTSLTKFAEDQNEEISKIFVWAHGDGGPMTESVNGGFGLYYFKERGLLRFDSKNPEFVRMNDALWNIEKLNEDDYTDDTSLYDYLIGLNFSDEMLTMAAAGYSNTLCSNSRDVSLRQCIRWSKLWHEEEMQQEADGMHDGDYYFKNSYKVLIDHLKQDAQIEIGTPVAAVEYSPSRMELNSDDVKVSSSGSDDDVVKVTAKNGTIYKAKSVVITSSPHVLKSGIMKFKPPLHNDIIDALDTTHMHNVVKVIMKFKEPVWPRGLHGMICSDKSMLMPEIWFRIIDKEKVHDNEEAGAYCIGFCTADHADRIASIPKEEVMSRAVNQLDIMFGQLESHHMVGDLQDINNVSMEKLAKPSESYLGGMFWDWNPQHHPYIGGGYCSPKVSTSTEKISILSKPIGNRLFLAGEGTMNPGATAHAAMDSGTRSADYVAKLLSESTRKPDDEEIKDTTITNKFVNNNAVIATSVSEKLKPTLKRG